MKQYLYPLLALLAVAALSRLPHPARDISKLDPVQAIYIHMEAGELCMVTDTGDEGTGTDLKSAADNMKANADREIYLETAEYLILSRDVQITPAFFTLLRPSAKVVYADEEPELSDVTDYLDAHPPKTTLNHIRAQECP